MESLVDLALSSAADAAVWLKKSFSSALLVVATAAGVVAGVVAEVVAEVEDDDEVAETNAAKSLLQEYIQRVLRDLCMACAVGHFLVRNEPCHHHTARHLADFRFWTNFSLYAVLHAI